jgi:hypothetical protein
MPKVRFQNSILVLISADTGQTLNQETHTKRKKALQQDVSVIGQFLEPAPPTTAPVP